MTLRGVILLLFGVCLPTRLIVKDGSKHFVQNFLFAKSELRALENINLSLEAGFTCFVGPSGSGKSTLAKCVCSLEPLSRGLIEYSEHAVSCYLGLQHRITYEPNKYVEEYVCQISELAPIVQVIGNVFDVSSWNGTQIASLLESQRCLFTIYHELLKACKDTPADSGIIVVLDEYLDKLVPSVRTVVIQKLKSACVASDSKMMVIVITHSEGVMMSCNCTTVALKAGRVFSMSRDPRKLVRPAQLQLMQ
jgi:ABC-type glutathione transport system ATPase component